MPATTEKIPDKVPFNVYAMLIILTFIFTGGATWMLGLELSDTWHYFGNKEEHKELWDKAVHVTVINKADDKYPDNFELTKTDREEWDKAVKSLYPKETIEFPEKDYEWPTGYDPLQYSIQFNGDNMNPSKDRPDMDKQAKILLTLDKGEKTPAAPTAPAADVTPKNPADAAPKAPEAPAAPAENK
jgi:hypothetical protein